ncbi:hypothetical protein [uncultured Abyssibacter sp.]|uniref:hypothetical protein n=1 Tax=uncultured Abyssibacter sp. TaxID=2320202 RepID=UPI0032B25C40
MNVDSLSLMAWLVVASVAVFAVLGTLIPMVLDWGVERRLRTVTVDTSSAALAAVIDAELRATPEGR